MIIETRIYVYRHSGEWCYSCFTIEDCEKFNKFFDHSDTLGIDNDETEAVALAEAMAQFPHATICRLDD